LILVDVIFQSKSVKSLSTDIEKN